MAFNAYLVLKPKTGLPAFKTETIDTTFSKYISLEVSHFALGYSEPGTATAPGKLAFQTLNLNLLSVVNSPGFLTMCGLGQTFDSVTLYLRKSVSNSTARIYTIYHFGTVAVTGVTIDGNDGDGAPAVNLTLAVGQFAHHGSTTSTTGQVTPSLVGSWNAITSSTWAESPLDGPGWV